MNNKQDLLLYFILTGIVVFFLFFVISSAGIGYSVDSQCAEAKIVYDQNTCLSALSAKLNDESNSFKERNDAIWALGQLGDKEALKLLNGYYTGYDGGKSKYNEAISQYELKKAIELLESGFNLTRVVRQFPFVN